MISIVVHGVLGTAYRQDVVVDYGAVANGDMKVLYDLRRHFSTQYGDGAPTSGWALSPAPSGMWLSRVERAFDVNYAPAYLMVSVLIPCGQRLKDDSVLNKISRVMILNHSKFINQNVIQYECDCDWSFLKPLSQEIEGCLEPFDCAISNYTDSTDGEIAYYDGDLSKMMREMWSGKFIRFGTVFCGRGLLSPDKECPIVTAVDEQTKSTTTDIIQDEPIVEKQDTSLNELKEDELNDEKAAFYRTKEIGTREAYNQYLETYPNGWFAEEARKMRDSMTVYGPPLVEAPVQLEKITPVSGNSQIKQKRLRQIIISILALLATIAILLIIINRCKHEAVDNSKASMVFKVNGVPFTMNLVDGGSFMMGANSEDRVAKDWEKPQHWVTLDSYYIGETEVTQELWEAVMNDNPSQFKGKQMPVEHVSYDDCLLFIQRLKSKTGKSFRLPTEAEWEFAARGGINSKHCKYAGSNDIDVVAWYWRNSGDNNITWDYSNDSVKYLEHFNHCQTHPVKEKAPNELGLYDMTGNVLEWCSDWFEWYSAESVSNPQGPTSANPDRYGKVRRGGYYLQSERYSRITYRLRTQPHERHEWLGFRLALSLY